MQPFTVRLLATAMLVSCAITGNAQDIKIGSIINLQNRFSGGGRDHFLDTQGYVSHENAFNAAFASQGNRQHAFVFTNLSKERDHGSGDWKIISAGGKKDGDALAYGDKIYLQNMHPGTGYLDEWDTTIDVYQPLFDRRSIKDANYPAFTVSGQQKSDVWIVGGQNAKNGTPVRAGNLITLGSSVHDGYFLRASFIAAELPMFKPYNTHCLVFTSKSHFDQGTQYWFVRLK